MHDLCRLTLKFQVLVLVCGGALMNGATIAAVTTTPPPMVGSSVSVQLSVAGLRSHSQPTLGVYELDLVFDPSIIRFEAITWGSQLDVLGLGSIRNAVVTTGTLKLFELSLDSPDDLLAHQPDAFVLADIEFVAVANGTSELGIVMHSIGDAYGHSLPATASPSSVGVGLPSTVVPEPKTATLAVVAILLAGAARLRTWTQRSNRHRLAGPGIVGALILLAAGKLTAQTIEWGPVTVAQWTGGCPAGCIAKPTLNGISLSASPSGIYSSSPVAQRQFVVTGASTPGTRLLLTVKYSHNYPAAGVSAALGAVGPPAFRPGHSFMLPPVSETAASKSAVVDVVSGTTYVISVTARADSPGGYATAELNAEILSDTTALDIAGFVSSAGVVNVDGAVAAKRSVGAIAADGVSRVLIRTRCQPSEWQTFEIKDWVTNGFSGFLHDAAEASTTGLSRRAAPCIALPDGTAYATVGYRTPDDFTTGSSLDAFANQGLRTITITSSGLITPPATSIVLDIVRPPVFLVHGFNADESAWDDFLPQLPLRSSLTIKALNYGFWAPFIQVSPVPGFQRGTRSKKHSHLGIDANSRVVAWQMAVGLRQFRSGNNLSGKPAVAGRADVVAHSLGGLIVRNLSSSPDPEVRREYIRPESYGRGMVRKLITLGTPHFGSPQAVLQLQEHNSCSRNLAAFTGSAYAFGTATLYGRTVNGAVADLAGDGMSGTPTSEVLKRLNTFHPNRIWFAAAAGTLDGLVDTISLSVAFSAIRTFCASHSYLPPDTRRPGVVFQGGWSVTYGEPLADRYEPARFNSIFDPRIAGFGTNIISATRGQTYPAEYFFQPNSIESRGSFVSTANDGAVPLRSALAGRAPGPGARVFPSTLHSTGMNSLGFEGLHLQNNPAVVAWVQEMLNVTFTSGEFR